MSRVAGLGYLGMLAGPAVIGPITALVPLNIALFLPVALCVVAAISAPVLSRATRDEHATGEARAASNADRGASPTA